MLIYINNPHKKNRKQRIQIDLNIFKIKYEEETEKTSMTLYFSVALSTVAFCLIMITCNYYAIISMMSESTCHVKVHFKSQILK
jgi:hypothetical protein